MSNVHYFIMKTNYVGLLISVVYVAFILGFSAFIKTHTKIKDETVRKFIHILSANWWLILLKFIDDPLIAVIGPIGFVFINSLFIFYPKLGTPFGCSNKNRNFGLVYYPFSLIILILYSYLGALDISAATVGVFCMGYGDGFAAILGSKWGKKKIPLPTGGKTYFGSIVMVIVCFLSSFIILALMSDLTLTVIIFSSILISLVATLVEVITPLGLDNISVPILSALIAGGIV